ncbi:MAG: VWA domain-containing protein [Chloroflexota bacterium]
MSNPCNATNFVPPETVWRWNFFKWMVPVLLAALLLGLLGLGRQYASIGAPSINAGPPDAETALSGTGTPGSTIDVRLDGESVGQTVVDDAGNWTFGTVAVAAAAGAHQYVAHALDPEGTERGVSDDWAFTVGSVVADYDLPTLGLERDGNSFVLSGTGSPGTTIELFKDGVSLGTTTVDDNGRWSLTTDAAPEGGSYVALATAPDGSEIGESEAFSYVPAALTAAAAATLNGSSFSWSGTGEPGSTIAILRDGEEIGRTQVDADGNWTFNGDVGGLTAGDYGLSADMVDGDGNVVASADSNGLLAVPALLSIGELVIGDNGRSYTLTGMSEPGSEVVIYVDGEEVGRTQADADGNWTFDGSAAGLLPGSYSLSVDVLDGDGNVVASADSDASLAISSGEITVGDMGLADDGASFMVSGTGVPGSEVVIFLNGEEVGRTQVDADGNWSFSGSTADLAAGDYELSTQMLDADGNELGTAFASLPLVIGSVASSDSVTGQLEVLVADADPETGDSGSAPAGAPAVALILDSSWSMTFGIDYTGPDVGANTIESERLTADNPNSRIAVAKAGLIDFVENGIPAGTQTALRVFGNLRGDLQCQTDLMVPYGTLDQEQMISVIEEVRPAVNANTAIASSLQQVAQDLEGSTEGRRTIVLVTDGDETCGGDPEAVIADLADQGFDVSVNIIGFAINDDALKSKLESWAETGNGSFFEAADSESLTESLRSAFAIPYIVRDADGEQVAVGLVGRMPVELPVGSYEVTVLTSPNSVFEIEVMADETTSVTIE